MPEGPSIVIAKEEMQQFSGKKVIAASGISKIDIDHFAGKTVSSFKSWGKHLLICFDDFTVRIHFLMFGSYLINERKDSIPKLSLFFDDGEINLYACSIKILEGNIDSHYDWSADLMNDGWNPKKAKAKLKKFSEKMVCDVLLEQEIFSGLGNIIKNEVLYRVHVHPKSLTGKIPSKKWDEIIREAQNYCFEFLHWKKNNVLKKNWLAHTKKICKRCDLPFIKEYTGVKKRRSFYCENCQKLHE